MLECEWSSILEKVIYLTIYLIRQIGTAFTLIVHAPNTFIGSFCVLHFRRAADHNTKRGGMFGPQDQNTSFL